MTRKIKDILNNAKLAPSKKRGQNFLVHQQSAERIVELADITQQDTVLELGVGFGSLTLPLALKAAKVIGIEIDSGIIDWHRKENILPSNVALIHENLLKSDFRELARDTGGTLKIVANLPYSISNPLLFKLIESKDVMQYAVLMLQKEVGDRICAPPGNKNYGVLSVLLSSCASVTKLMDVSAAQFHPRPKVDSIVVKIVFKPVPEQVKNLPEHNFPILKKIVNAAFQKRRKTLLNALSSSPLLDFDKQSMEDMIRLAHISPGIRAEKLNVAEYIELANIYYARQQEGN